MLLIVYGGSMRSRISIIALVVLAIAFLSLIKGWWIPNRPDPDKYPVRGIDVSHHNGEIDWKKVKKSGIDFVFMKATEGSDMTDKRFANNWTEAGKAGLYRGAYHFFSTTSSGEKQALNYISTVPREPGMLPPVIDIEFAKSRSRMTAEQFYQELEILKTALEKHYGVPAVIYTTQEFRDNYFPDQKIENLWAREILFRVDRWAPEWLFWQYSSRGNVPGIRSRTDLNVFRKPERELEKLLVR